MVQDNSELSPEKQLLKLIEESSKGQPGGGAGASTPSRPAAVPPLPVQASPPHTLPLTGVPHPPPAVPSPAGRPAAPLRSAAPPAFALDALHSRLLFAKEKNIAAFMKSLAGPLDVKKVNLALTFLAVLTGMYFAGSSVMLAMKTSLLPAFSFKVGASSKAGVLKYETNLKAFSYYMEKVHSRDIFKIGRVSSQAAAVIDQAAIRAAQEAVTGKFKLVGISWSDDPDAMVEETTSGNTYFMKRGQVLDGVKVEAIFKDKVVLNYNGVDVELR